MENQKSSKERRSYEPDFKAEILKLLVSGKRVKEISETFGIAENLLYRWKSLSTMMAKSKTNESENNSKSAAEIAKLKAEIERLKTDREILKKALGLLEFVRLRDVYDLVSLLSKNHKISYLCSSFDISRTAYYRYKRGKSHNSDSKYNRPKHEIRMEFIRNFKRYGSRRIKASLEQKGIKLGCQKVAEIMRTEGLRAIQPPKFIPRTTNSKHGKRVCENLLLDKRKPESPNQVWVSDHYLYAFERGEMGLFGHLDGALLPANSWLGIGR